MRKLLVTAWLAASSAMIAMVIGHLGAPDLNYLANQISSYAANAPHGGWISASILLSALTLLLIFLLITRHRIFGDGFTSHLSAVPTAAAFAGLLVLARYQETAKTVTLLKNSGYAAIRQQSFHDAGLLIFFFSTILFVMMSGVLAAMTGEGWKAKLTGAFIFLTGPSAFFFMRTKWPELLGITGESVGLRQRTALFCLWFANILILSFASSRLRLTAAAQPARGGSG